MKLFHQFMEKLDPKLGIKVPVKPYQIYSCIICREITVIRNVKKQFLGFFIFIYGHSVNLDFSFIITVQKAEEDGQ